MLNDISLIVQEVVKYMPQLLGQQPIQITQPATINCPSKPAVMFPQRPVTVPNPLIYSGPGATTTTPQGVTTTFAINEPDGVQPPG